MHLIFLLALLLLPAPVHGAAEHSHPARTVPKPEDYHAAPPGAPPGREIRKYAEDAPARPQQNFGVQPIHDNQLLYTLRADRLEWREKDGDDVLLWDAEAWIGGDFHKLYLESEGEKIIDDEVEEATLEVLYSRTISPFWDLQAGLRHDFEPRPTRGFLALGIQGLAPYWFEVDATLYLSDDGDLSAGLEVEYDFLFTQRLIFQPRLETSLALQEVEELNIGSGFNEIVLGARLRYEISRKFAPYVGISWSRLVGETENLVEAAGGEVESTDFVAGVRFWF